jgi:hypothetical protein
MPSAPSTQRSPSRLGRVLGAVALLCLFGTFLFSQIDYVRRHHVGMDPAKYWLPQLLRIWLPGGLATLICLIAAFVLERRARRD